MQQSCKVLEKSELLRLLLFMEMVPFPLAVLFGAKWKAFFALTLWSDVTARLPRAGSAVSGFSLTWGGTATSCNDRPEARAELGLWELARFPFWTRRWERWGPSGSLCLANAWNQCLELLFQVPTWPAAVGAQGSCFQMKLPMGLQQLVENGPRLFQQKEDKACPTTPCSHTVKRWRCGEPSFLPCR